MVINVLPMTYSTTYFGQVPSHLRQMSDGLQTFFVNKVEKFCVNIRELLLHLITNFIISHNCKTLLKNFHPFNLSLRNISKK